jgi:senataxin
MNVALTRAQNFLFVIASLRSIIVNPYWKDLVDYAREKNAIISVPLNRQLGINNERIEKFPDLATNIKL